MARRAILIGPLAVQDRNLKTIFDRLEVKPKKDLLIGVDAGAQVWRRLGIRSHLAVGDWDSIRPSQSGKILRETPHITLTTAKNRSDFFYALDAAVAARATEIVCLGMSGGRPDHHFGVLSDLANAASVKGTRLKSVRAIGPEAEYRILTSEIPRWRGHLAKGTLVSIFSLGDVARRVNVKGFQYPLKNFDLRPSSHGLSNFVTSPTCEVSLSSGRLLVIIPYWPFEKAYGI